MLDYAIMKAVTIMLLGAAAAGATAQAETPAPLAVTLPHAPRVLYVDHPETVELVLRNAGDTPLAFGVWSCGWDTQWRIRQDGDALGLVAPACTRNVRRTIRLAAGQSYARPLALIARLATAEAPARFALGFQPLDASQRYWSAPLTLTVATHSAASRDDDPPP